MSKEEITNQNSQEAIDTAIKEFNRAEELKTLLKRKEQECEQKDKDIKYLIKCLDNSFKAQQDCELHWEREKKKLKAENDSLKSELMQTHCYLDADKETIDQLKTKNEELKTMLKDLSYESQKFCYQIEEQTKQLEPFKDEYFKGLDNVAIAELAKKSIRITAENSKLEQNPYRDKRNV